MRSIETGSETSWGGATPRPLLGIAALDEFGGYYDVVLGLVSCSTPYTIQP
jgi:hypothetical protein